MLNSHPAERIVLSIPALCCALALLLHAPSSLAGPEGEAVIHGSAEFSRDGNLTTIETSHEAIIDYQRFNIGHDETVRFVQPDVTSRVLNRILGNDPTQIDGSLLANGQVYFLNPAGIFVGANALIDVAGIYAAAGSLSNEDFRAGIDRFTELQGPVENLGTIQAGRVHLIGRQVANYGSIVARGGIVTLLAGEDVYIVEAGGSVMIKLEGAAASPEDGDARLEQSGSIDASGGQVFLKAGDLYSLALGAPGTTRASEILLEAGDGSVVNVAGMLDASDTSPGGTGGKIEVLGDRIALVGAELEASGDAGGGTVYVGGGRHGEGTARNASGTFISASSEIHADALGAGDGGEIVIWSDGATRSYGSLSARGGAHGGDGGLVETSGRLMLDVGEHAPDLSAAAGHGGTWELDPADITIVNNAPGSIGIPLDPDFSVAGHPSFVTDDVIENALNKGMTVLIRTLFPGGEGQGNITQEIDAGIEKLGGPESELRLEAANDIQLFGGITVASNSSAKLNVTLLANFNHENENDPDPLPEQGKLLILGSVSTGGGNFSAEAGTVIDIDGTVNTGGGSALIGTTPGVKISLAKNIFTEGGKLSLGANTTLDGKDEQQLNAGSGGRAILTAVGSLTKTTIGDLLLGGEGGIKLDQDVDVKGGSLHFLDPLFPTGKASKLEASADVIFDEGLNMPGTAVIAGRDLKITGNARAQSLEAVEGLVKVEDGFVEVSGALKAKDSITVEDDAVTAGSITATNGSIKIGSFALVKMGDLKAGSGITIEGFVKIENGDLIAGVDSEGRNTAAIPDDADIVIDGSATVLRGKIEAGDDLVINGEADKGDGLSTIAGDVIAVDGSINVIGPIEVGTSKIPANVRAGGKVILSAGGNVTGSLIAGQNIDSADFENLLTIGGDLVTTDAAADILFEARSNLFEAGGNLLVIGNIRSAGEVDITGALKFTGNIDAGRSIRSDSDLELTGDLISRSGGLEIMGNLTAQNVRVLRGGVGPSEDDTSIGRVDGLIEANEGTVILEVDTRVGGIRAKSVNIKDGAIEVAAREPTADPGDGQEGELALPDPDLGLIRATEGDITIDGGSVSGAEKLVAANDVLMMREVRFASVGSVEAGNKVEIKKDGSLVVAEGDLKLRGSLISFVGQPKDEIGFPLPAVDVQRGSLIVESRLESEGDLTASEDVILLADATLGGVVTAFRDVSFDDPEGLYVVNADIFGQRDVTFAAPVVLQGERGQTILAGGRLSLRGVTKNMAGDLLLEAGGQLSAHDVTNEMAGNLTVKAGGQLSVHNVTNKMAGDLTLEGATIEFASEVRAVDDLRLVASGPSTRADGATMFKEGGDLTLSAGGGLSMEPGGSLFVGGNLLVEARSVELGDVSADGTLTIDAEEIAVVSPRASETNGFETKEGFQRVNFFGDTIDFANAPVEGDPILGTPEGRVGLTGDPLVAFGVIVTGGTLATSGEPIPETTGQDIVNKEQVELSPSEQQGPIIVAQLAAVASQRPLWADELVSYLDCAALADCAPGTPSITNDSRLRTAEVQMLVVRYRSIYKNLGAVREALSSAIDAFEEQHPDEPVAGLAFRSFLEADGTHASALESVRELRELRSELDRLALSPPQVTDAWLQLLEKLDVPGISLGELDQAIRPKGTELGEGPGSGRVASSARASASGPWRP